MCMKDRFYTFGRHASRALCMMAFCGLVWACVDEYKLDDEKPDWLSENIYSLLEKNGNFTNYLKLLEDKAVNPEGVRNLKDVLSKTGSKTVFAAPDEAWNQFYQANAALPETNPWHNATSYDKLSPSQKKLLIHTSMLNNAIVMENLSAEDGDGTAAPLPGQYMRRYTDVDVIDSVTFLPADQVPYSYNPDDTCYWTPYSTEARGGNGKGIYLVTDATRNMMLHFTREHMGRTEIGITDDDFEKFMGAKRSTGDVHIYNSRIVEKDGVAENGYLNVVDKVLKPLNNMAEVIRTNGKTNIFSHMLERYSYPMPNDELTEAYARLTGFTGKVYTKKFFALKGEDGKAQKTTPDGKDFGEEVALRYDPGWNEYYFIDEPRKDMASMFVPNDKTMMEYFSKGGGGWDLIETYAPDPEAVVPEGDFDALYKKIDYIPLGTLAELLNVIMFPSFVGAVPSKIQTLRDFRSQEEMFTPDDVKEIDECILANNGAVYIMNKVYGPASYISVVGPANISTTNKIMKWAINNGTDLNKDEMHMNYFAYLMAMRSWFTFFMPSDEALTRYYDPISFTSQHARVIRFELLPKATGSMPLQTGRVLYPYGADPSDPATWGQITATPYRTDQLEKQEVLNRLRDILESHTIVHEDGQAITSSPDEYYLTKNGSAVKVTKVFNATETDPTKQYTVTKVQGGFQLENEREGMTGGARGTVDVNITENNTRLMANGHTLILDDSPIIPASRSIYRTITNEFGADCKAFFDLTDFQGNSDIIKACFPSNANTSKLYMWEGQASGAIDFNVSFLSNYNYSVFVPTDAAIAAAEANGLPTWDDIRADYLSLPVDPDEGELDPTALEDDRKRVLNGADSLRLQTKITYLSNFIRCHFVDGSVFEDKSLVPETEHQTSSYDTENGVFIKVLIDRETEGGKTVLKVKDNVGGAKLSLTGDLRNIMTRDMTCIKDPSGNLSGNPQTPTGQKTLNNVVLQRSSFAVVHQIDGVLNHKALVGGRHDSDWATPSACKKYLKRFAIPNASSIKKMKRHE